MECKTLTQEQMQQTIDQLRANAKSHKKTVDKLSAKVSLLTQQRDDAASQLTIKEQEAAFYKTELEMRGYKTFEVGGHKAMSLPVEKKEQSYASKVFCFIISCFGAGFFAGLGWFVIDMVIRSAMK